MDDVRAVMDAAGCERAALFGVSEGGAMSVLFAATYPERTQALVLYGTYSHFPTWVLANEKLEEFLSRSSKTGVPARACHISRRAKRPIRSSKRPGLNTSGLAQVPRR